MNNQRPISEWVDFLTKYAEEITFEGCGYKLVSPEDADEIAAELEALRAEVERLREYIRERELIHAQSLDAEPTALANSGPKERSEAFEHLQEELEETKSILAATIELHADDLRELWAVRDALRADQERLDWLITHLVSVDFEPTVEEGICVILRPNNAAFDPYVHHNFELRDAIDAARGES